MVRSKQCIERLYILIAYKMESSSSAVSSAVSKTPAAPPGSSAVGRFPQRHQSCSGYRNFIHWRESLEDLVVA